MTAVHGGANAGDDCTHGQPSGWSTAEPVGYPPPARLPGVAQTGRHREHLFPGRRRRVAPSFSAQEYAVVVTAAARLGLTPTGYCAHAALTLATDPGAAPLPAPTVAGGPGRDAAMVEALAALQAQLADARTAVVRVGTNLNQAARALNATGDAPVWLHQVVETCSRALAAVDVAASAIHRQLR
jgi:hypothetical protein